MDAELNLLSNEDLGSQCTTLGNSTVLVSPPPNSTILDTSLLHPVIVMSICLFVFYFFGLTSQVLFPLAMTSPFHLVQLSWHLNGHYMKPTPKV